MGYTAESQTVISVRMGAYTSNNSLSISTAKMHEISTSSLRGTWSPDAILGLRKFSAVVCTITWTCTNSLYFQSQYLRINIHPCKIT